ncbi:unnamed protein product [Pieris macdunnoughi]|uniref:Cytochrome P450 n=1 Tax=Pieris macdunnoughi TaxID=345717 RepID=A0A821MV46_9NEOP|nr:unnamed protein product [Pieris macdunnoughi]
MILWIICILPIICYGIFRFKRRRLYGVANKVTGSEDDIPFFGIAPYLVGGSERAMDKLQEYAYVTTSVGGFAKAFVGPLLYYMVTDAEKVEIILKQHLEKDNIMRFMRFAIGYASIFAPVSIWRPRRKIAVPSFSPKVISNFVDVFARESHKLAHKLKPTVGKGPFQIWRYLNAYSLDAVMETAMGVHVNAQENHDNPILTATNRALYYVSERIFKLWLQPDWLYRWFPQYGKLVYYCKVLHGYTDEIIEKKRVQVAEQEKAKAEGTTQSYQPLNFLDVLINQSGGEKGYSNLELREEVMTFIIAAMDTSAVSMGFTLKLLAKYPEVQQKVFEELDAVFGNSDRLLEKDDLPKLQYLERVVKETLRLYPSVPVITRTTTEDVVAFKENMTLLKGSGFIVSIWGIHRNPKYWGPDAHCFDPDRFLPERIEGVPPCAFIPFSHGPRNCLGYQYAMMSIKTVLSSILRRYRVVGEPEAGPIPHMRVKMEIMLKPLDGFEVTLEER